MNEELTMGDVFEDIAERVAAARMRALIGERHDALSLLQCARIDYLRFREVLRSYPGSLALEHSIAAAQAALCEERAQARVTPEAEAMFEDAEDSERAA